MKSLRTWSAIIGAMLLSGGVSITGQSKDESQLAITLRAESAEHTGRFDTLTTLWSPYDSRDSILVEIYPGARITTGTLTYITAIDLRVGPQYWAHGDSEIPDPNTTMKNAIWIPSTKTYIVSSDSSNARHAVTVATLHPAAWGQELRRIRSDLVIVGLRIHVAEIGAGKRTSHGNRAQIRTAKRSVDVYSLD